jgi:hypothetical protein
MDKDPAAELTRLRQLSKSLESGMKIIREGVDVTAEELKIIKLEIAYLEKVSSCTDDSK